MSAANMLTSTQKRGTHHGPACRCLTVEVCRSAHLDQGQRLPLVGHIHVLPLILILCCDTARACLPSLMV